MTAQQTSFAEQLKSWSGGRCTVQLSNGAEITGRVLSVGEDCIRLLPQDKDHLIPFSAILFVRLDAET